MYLTMNCVIVRLCTPLAPSPLPISVPFVTYWECFFPMLPTTCVLLQTVTSAFSSGQELWQASQCAAHWQNYSRTPCYISKKNNYSFVTCPGWSGGQEKLNHPGKRALWSSEIRQVSAYFTFMDTNRYHAK